MSDLPPARVASSPLAALAVAVAGGIALAHYFALQSRSVLILGPAIAFGFALFSSALLIARHLKLASIFLFAAFFFTGLVLLVIEHRTVAPNRIAQMYDEGVITISEPVEVTGTIQGQPESAPDSFYLTVRVDRIRSRAVEREASGVIVLLANVRDQKVTNEYDLLELRHGARVRVMTMLDREDSFRNPGVSPLTEYLERKGYDASGVIKSPLLIERLDDESVFLPLAWLYEWRDSLAKDFRARFSEETAGVLDAALLGNRYNVSHASADRFRAGGTFHVLVIAGLHISFIGGLVFLLARSVTQRRILQFLLSATFLWGYTIAVGARESVVRAALMFTLVALALVVSRRANSLNAISGAALALLGWRPSDLFDPSFQLTFLSVLLIVLLAVPLLQRMQRVGSWRPTMETPYPPAGPRWFRTFSECLFWSEREWQADMARSNVTYRLFKTPLALNLERWHVQRPIRFAVAAIVVSASVQIGLLPLLIIYFHRLSIASLVLNIFVGALMAVLALVALTAIIISHVSIWLASPLIVLAERVNWLTIHLVDPFARLGVASIRLPHYTGWPAGIYVLYYLPLGFLLVALARWNPLGPVLIAKNKPKTLSPTRLRFATAAFVIVLAVIVVHPFSAARPDGKLRVDFLDVGQGDSALLTMPDGTTLLIDGGGRPNIGAGNEDENGDPPFERDTRSIGEGVVSEFLWSRGLDRVDYILPTHADADHIDGLNDVARNFTIRAAILARTPPEDREYARFAATMKDGGVPIEKIGAGDLLRLGNVRVEVLWPPANTEPAAPSRNNDSVILRVRYGDRALLFTGDIEKEGEYALLNERVDLRTDIVKVAHHGSRTSSTAALVAATHPSLAIISVGRTSVFGHPNKEVVERWRASGAEVMTTGERGTISAITDGKDLKVTTFIPR